MTSHAQVEPVLPVSFAGPPKSGAPLTGESSLPEEQVGHFASVEALDLALLNDVGLPQVDIDSMTVNDKQFALRAYLESGGSITPFIVPLPAPVIEATDAPDAEVAPYGTVWIDESTGIVYQTPGDGTWDIVHDFELD